jgi:hypothetical protein
MLQGCGRATLIGAPTAGSTGNSFAIDLPGDGGARICAVQVKFADGRDFVPMGVPPIEGVIKGETRRCRRRLTLRANTG